MANPLKATRGTDCEECGYRIDEGEDIYFTDMGKLCKDCADEQGYVCDCGNYKNPDFYQCYECATN